MRLSGTEGAKIVMDGPAAAELRVLLNSAPELQRHPCRLPADTALFSRQEEEESLFVLCDGELSLFVETREILQFHPGDLIMPGTALPRYGGSITGSFGTRLERIEIAAIERLGVSDPKLGHAWRNFIQEYVEYALCIVSHLSRGERSVSPDLRRYGDGEIIIEQGRASAEVFTLLNGRAEVLVDGVKIGEVLEDEIFGAIGALCGIARNATVRCTGPCEVLSLPGERFAELLSLRPDTVVKLVQDLASAVTRMNQQLIDFKRHICPERAASGEVPGKSFT